jgi:hypothetical protein
MASTYPDEFCDISQNMKAASGDDHVHPVNRGVHPGTAKASDFKQSEGVEVPTRNARERVDPGAVNAQRRAPLIDVTAITSGHGNSHNAEPPPSRL